MDKSLVLMKNQNQKSFARDFPISDDDEASYNNHFS